MTAATDTDTVVELQCFEWIVNGLLVVFTPAEAQAHANSIKTYLIDRDSHRLLRWYRVSNYGDYAAYEFEAVRHLLREPDDD